MAQLCIKTDFDKKEINCVFTGHRILEEDFSPRSLKKEIKKLIEKGIVTFYNGMAMGFDLLAAEAVLYYKKKYPQIRLVACVPCYEQEKNYNEKDKKRYVSILKKADEKITLSNYYFKGCMQARDRYMVDRSDVMIAYCKKDKGGAAFTVKYFQKKHPTSEIIFL